MTDALDGNAIAAQLLQHFGVEMTGVSGVCQHCGAAATVAELLVYRSGPGDVARCPSCGNFFCRECITEHDELILCAACLKRITAPKERRRNQELKPVRPSAEPG